MPPRIPVYTDHDAVFRADACQPLARAAVAGQVRLQSLVHGHYPGRPLPRSALPGLKTIGVWDAEGPQNWGLDWHQNEGIELTLLESGAVEFAVEGSSHRLKPADLAVTRPWQRHRLGNPHIESGRLHWVVLDLGVRRPHQPWRWPSWILLAHNDLDELTDILRHNEQPVWHNAQEVRSCFQKIARAIEADRDGSSVSWLTVLLNELLLLTLEMLRSQEVPLDARLSGTERTVELFLHDLRDDREQIAQPWSVRRMADACGLGVTQFTQYCRLLTNLTPMQHLTGLRMQQAAKLLMSDQRLNNCGVAARCGFGSAQYFATVFRRHYGCTPQQYRLQTTEETPAGRDRSGPVSVLPGQAR